MAKKSYSVNENFKVNLHNNESYHKLSRVCDTSFRGLSSLPQSRLVFHTLGNRQFRPTLVCPGSSGGHLEPPSNAKHYYKKSKRNRFLLIM